MRCPSEFERAPDGGSDEIAIYEAYLDASFLVGVPSIVAEVSSSFGFCPSQLTLLTWRTLMAIQVLGELHGFVIGVHEILYSYYFAPLNLVPLLKGLRLSLLIMALGRMPSVGLVSGRQLGVSSDDEPRGCAQCREGSSFHHLGDSQLSLPQGSRTGSYFLWELRGSRDLLPRWSTVVFLWLTENFKCFLRSNPFRVYAEDWSPEWSFMGETRYLNSLLDTLIWPESPGCQELVNLVRVLGPELFLEVIVTGIRLSRYDASRLDLESKGLWVLTTSGLA
ncbi:hypothetical protein YC2023_077098 [Brassica napus]